MSETVERSSLDLRYEGCRLRNEAAEARLLASIAERDIEQPLAGVDTPQGRLLLDGFKRYRCATKLGIEYLLPWPINTLGRLQSCVEVGVAEPREVVLALVLCNAPLAYPGFATPRRVTGRVEGEADLVGTATHHT